MHKQGNGRLVHMEELFTRAIEDQIKSFETSKYCSE